ncbi:glycoside hydrolase family 3 protein [Sphingomonas sp. URHD0057]|uniref:glycoside hydrolase family 3 protein n=1 Tax=Sphingomonas sp. URHD0057 TaxID=1380389 RepID=UPI00055F1141|nr:glycoside hydrolase family 3 protein [Sphingomonas sp. URHD0057]
MNGGRPALLLAALLAWTAASPAQPVPSAIAHPARWPAAHSPATITDSATEKRITDLLAKMTLEQKVGQVVQGDISTITPADLARYPLGSILAGGNSGPHGNERATAAQWHQLIESFRAASAKPAANGVGIPILFGFDAVHGNSNLPNATIFPHNIGLGATHDPALIRRIGEITAAEVAGTGIEWTFAPTLAVPQDLRWGRSYEGYSSDPKLVADYARQMVLGLQGPLRPGVPVDPRHVAASAKHFIADGGTDEGHDQGDAKISEDKLIALHSAGYPPAIDAGALTVMVSFSGWNGTKHVGNESLLTGVLKNRMGFEGVVVGDWNAHGQIAGCTVTDCPQSLLAGLDMYMAPDSWKGLYESLLRETRAGQIPMTRLDDAVRRILRVKVKLGLLGGRAVTRFDPSQNGRSDHLAISREAVAKSLVLLKNEGSVLPIKRGANVLVTGPGADNIAMQTGGWTVSWQGDDVTSKDFVNGQTVYSAIRNAVARTGGKTSLSTDGSFANKPDVAIVVFGEKPYAEFLGDTPTLAYHPGNDQDLDLLKKLKAAGVPVVSVFLSGRPLFVSREINSSEAFVAAWLPGTQANGIADVLVEGAAGKAMRDFTGSLPFAWPADARSPVTEPLFKVGYGLSYAHPRHVGTLSDDPKMNLAAAIDVNNLFANGRAAGPWALNLADSAGGRTVSDSKAQSLGGALSMEPIDLGAQENARRFSWAGPASISIVGQGADFARQLNNAFAIRLDGRIDAMGSGPVRIAVDNTPLDATDLLKAQKAGVPFTVKIPLRCFADAGAKFASVANPLRIEGSAGLALVLQSARVEAVGEPLACPPVTH